MKLAIIGAGNMGGAIAEGVVREGVVAGDRVVVASPSSKFCDTMTQKGVNIRCTTSNLLAARDADMIVIAVKPWLMEQVLGEIAGVIRVEKQIIVSIAAGVKFEQMDEYLGINERVGLFRVMPNTAISLGKSVTFVASHNATAEEKARVVKLFSALGSVFEVDEKQMAAVTALASSGIAFALKYVEAAAQWGAEQGVEQAQQIVEATVEGALALLRANNSTPKQEIDKVTTPGGITLKGLEQMEKGGFSASIKDGLKATK